LTVESIGYVFFDLVQKILRLEIASTAISRSSPCPAPNWPLLQLNVD